MVDQLRRRRIDDESVLRAFEQVPRDLFVAPELAARAYRDEALPLIHQQTISQPYVVALMLQALGLRPGERVLEVGTGSGWCAALLSTITGHVYSLDRLPAMIELARENLAAAGIDRVELACRDGSLGWPERAPFDAIVVSAAAPEVPAALVAQLERAGRIVVPVGPDPDSQMLTLMKRVRERTYVSRSLGPVQFVPLIGEQGWPKAR